MNVTFYESDFGVIFVHGIFVYTSDLSTFFLGLLTEAEVWQGRLPRGNAGGPRIHVPRTAFWPPGNGILALDYFLSGSNLSHVIM